METETQTTQTAEYLTGTGEGIAMLVALIVLGIAAVYWFFIRKRK